MIACVIHGAKDLRFEKRPDPQPGEGEVLVRFGPVEFVVPICTIITMDRPAILLFVSR
jgi:hypothetical protein